MIIKCLWYLNIRFLFIEGIIATAVVAILYLLLEKLVILDFLDLNSLSLRMLVATFVIVDTIPLTVFIVIMTAYRIWVRFLSVIG